MKTAETALDDQRATRDHRSMLRRLYTRLWLISLPREPHQRLLAAVRAWFVLAIIIIWLLAIIAFGDHR
jgi:uncharacterized membrane protein YdbT with pleckstrin-like domain